MVIVLCLDMVVLLELFNNVMICRFSCRWEASVFVIALVWLSLEDVIMCWLVSPIGIRKRVLVLCLLSVVCKVEFYLFLLEGLVS